MLKFDASIFGGELPIGLGVVGIAVMLPGGDFLDSGLFVGDRRSRAAQFEDAFARFLPPEPNIRTLKRGGGEKT